MFPLPTGIVTFLFTDIEGSTRLLHHLGDRYPDVLETHRRLLRAAIEAGGGHEFETQGDGLFVAFASATDALKAAIIAQRALHEYPWPEAGPVRVRMGLHTGQPTATDSGYVGLDLHRTARICTAGHGGQVLLSQTTRDLVEDNLPEGVDLRDLGEHRLKDLTRPQRLFQVVAADLPADFPPLKSLNVLPHNLPVQLTSVIGREREIAEVGRLLPTTRLLTLTGSGGVGKTRLALQVAAEALEAFKEGVWLVELAALSDPVFVPHSVASALGVQEQPGRTVLTTLLDYLQPRRVLLVLDNCEHVVAACSQLAEALLRDCPHLHILATSRVALGIPGEAIWRVPSLSMPSLGSLPSLDHLRQYEAVRLFAERAVFSDQGFAITGSNAPGVVQICQRLDGIPLAIELAAARVKVLAVEQIAARLDDRFHLLTGGSRTVLPRHQTLRAALEWSYDLLSEKERTLLGRLSVFTGGWTLEAAEAICSGDDVEASDVLDLLTNLVDKSLVMMETRGAEARYRLLETVRQYSRGRLVESGEAADVARRHRDWFMELAERAASHFLGRESHEWWDRLETEHDNLRAALEWSSGSREAEAELRLAGALFRFWVVRGYWNEGRRRLEGALALSSDAPASITSEALVGAAWLAWQQGDHVRATALCEDGMALCRELGTKTGIAQLLAILGVVAGARGDYVRATALTEESLALFRALKDPWHASIGVANLGHFALVKGDYERAAAFFEEGLALSREVGEKWLIAYSLRSAGIMAFRQGDHGRAAALYAEGLILFREVGDRFGTEMCLVRLADVASAEGHYEQAAQLFGAAEALREALGGHRDPVYQAEMDQRLASARTGLGDAAFAAAWTEGRAMTLEQAVEYALKDAMPGQSSRRTSRQ